MDTFVTRTDAEELKDYNEEKATLKEILWVALQLERKESGQDKFRFRYKCFAVQGTKREMNYIGCTY